MPRRHVLTACLLAPIAALTVWWCWPAAVTPPTNAGDSTATGTQHDSKVESGTSATDANGKTRVEAGGESAIVGPSARRLQVQLRNLHPEAPWTQDLRLELDDRRRNRSHATFNSQGQVDATGKCTLPLPAWWRAGMAVRLRLQGRNRHYRDIHYRVKGKLALAATIVIDAQPVAELNGRVLDTSGQAVPNVRISAFATRAGHPFGAAIGATGTNQHGAYQLLAPPNIPLLIAVTPMQPNPMRFRRDDGVNDSGELRADLLPAQRELQLSILHPGMACDFTLDDATKITGHVLWPNGSPVACRVRFDADKGTRLALSGQSDVLWTHDRRIVANGSVSVDDQGYFEVPASPDVAVAVTVLEVRDTRIIGDLPTHHITAPSTLELTLPFPVTLRAIHLGQLMPYARILMADQEPWRADRDGTSRVLIASNTRIRADRGPLRSPWQWVASSQDPQTIDLVMTSELLELQIGFENELSVHNTTVHWQCDDGRSSVEQLTRKSTNDPFRMWLEPGNYQLRIDTTTGEREGMYLLPIRRKIELTQPLGLRVPARFGGTFTLDVLDDQGRSLAGSCSVRSPDGKERLVRMMANGELGAFGAETALCRDILAPGPYQLLIDLGGHGVRTHYVTITKHETTPVVLRL